MLRVTFYPAANDNRSGYRVGRSPPRRHHRYGSYQSASGQKQPVIHSRLDTLAVAVHDIFSANFQGGNPFTGRQVAWNIHIPGKTKTLKKLDEVPTQIDLAGVKAMASRGRERMVVVVPALTKGRDGGNRNVMGLYPRAIHLPSLRTLGVGEV